MPRTAARSIDPPAYNVTPLHTSEDATIAAALAILDRRLRQQGPALDHPTAIKDFLRLRLAEVQQEYEVFGVVFLDAQLHLIEAREMFRGTLTQTSIYPREVVKLALALNSAAVVLYHNHPSGSPEPSRADEHLTSVLKSALSLVDVRVLDHFVVGSSIASFAERGLL